MILDKEGANTGLCSSDGTGDEIYELGLVFSKICKT